MEDNLNDVNPGGVNGSGKGVVNTNHPDFIKLREAVVLHSQSQTQEEKMKYKLMGLKFKMNTYLAESLPSEIILIGEFIKDHLKAIDISQKQFARFLEIEETNLSAVIRGRRKINIDLAIKLGMLFDLSPNLWLSIQNKNELLSIDKSDLVKRYTLKELLKKTG